MSRIPKEKLEGLEKEPMIRNNGKQSQAQQPEYKVVDKISDNERALLAAKGIEIEDLRRKQMQLQKELTLASAELFRKGDELEAQIKDLAAKYKLEKGKRELNMKTGEIVEAPAQG